MLHRTRQLMLSCCTHMIHNQYISSGESKQSPSWLEDSFGVVCKVPLRSSSHEGLCLFSPEEIYWLWIMCVRWDYISWLVLWSIQQFTSDWKWNAPARVFIYWYRTLWWFFEYWLFDEELRASFLTNYTKSDTTALSIIWLLDVGVSTTLILRWVILKSLNQIRSQWW